jgi:hypothetical protein
MRKRKPPMRRKIVIVAGDETGVDSASANALGNTGTQIVC